MIAYLDSSRATLLERLKARKGKGPDDQFVSEEELDRFLAHFEVPEADERFIHIKNNTASTKAYRANISQKSTQPSQRS